MKSQIRKAENFPWAPGAFEDPIKMESIFRRESEEVRLQAGADRALRLFRESAENVPAYKDFLKSEGFQPSVVKDIGDIVSIPLTSKENYLRKYDRKNLCWDGSLAGKSWTISTTSGSTGEPFYFPRTESQDKQYAFSAELYLRAQFRIQERTTLYIVAFPMGAWIGGLFTYEAIKRVAERGYSLSIITPGINKTEIIKAVQNLGHDFDQVLIGSYAPFLKDIIDDGIRLGLNWSDYNLGFIFSAEAFGEPFRDYVATKTGLTNIYTDTLNHYGTVDLGTMAHETPLSILIRRIASSRPDLFESIFGQSAKVPTLGQYVPELFYFEELEGNLVCTASSGLPLIRYDLHDHGGVITLNQMQKIFASHGLNLLHEAKDVGIEDTIWNLPFVYVYERSDLSVSFFAFQVYPETVKKALSTHELSESLTGKFTMAVEYDGDGSQQLIVNIELKPETEESDDLHNDVTGAIVERLLEENSEYRKTYEEYSEKIHPRLIFWPYEDPHFFKPGTKQKWVKK
jgi:phenylacetate-CoA ligase